MSVQNSMIIKNMLWAIKWVAEMQTIFNRNNPWGCFICLANFLELFLIINFMSIWPKYLNLSDFFNKFFIFLKIAILLSISNSFFKGLSQLEIYIRYITWDIFLKYRFAWFSCLDNFGLVNSLSWLICNWIILSSPNLHI